MATTQFKGYVDRFAQDSGFDVGNDCIRLQEAIELSQDLPAVLAIGTHERQYAESEVREIARKMNRILAFGRTESSNKAVASMLALHGIVLDPA